jgi:hypothetical protein
MLSLIRVFIAAALFALPLVVVLQTPAYACSCADLTLEQRVDLADVIFVGTTESRRVIGPLPEPVPLSEPLTASTTAEIETTVAVQEYLKESGPESLAVRSMAFVSIHQGQEPAVFEQSGPGCQFAPVLGMDYLFFSFRRDDGLLSVGVCGMSIPIDDWSGSQVLAMIDEIRALLAPAPAATDAGTAVTAATPAVEELPNAGTSGGGSAGPPWAALAIGGALAGATLLSGFGWRLLGR